MQLRLRYALSLLGPLWIFACSSGADEGPRGSGGASGAPSSSAGQTTVAGASGSASVSGGASSVAGSAGQATTSAGSGPMPMGGGGAGGSAPTTGGTASTSTKSVVFVGGFNNDPLHLYDLDKASGTLTARAGTVDAGIAPTCLAIDPARKHLYVGNEEDEGGGITSFAIATDGSITRLNHGSGSDSGFTSLAVSPNGKLIAGASYGGGSASVLTLNADGSVGAEVGFYDFGEDAQAHCVAWDPTGKFLLVATKGANAVQQLKVAESGELSANAPLSVQAAPNAKPRHLAIHPSGKLAFVVTEDGSTVVPYQLSAAGTLSAGQFVSSLPQDFNGDNTGAHVELGLGGKFVYASNRGHDSVGVWAVNQDNGALTLVEHTKSNGASPHDFDIDRESRLLITANRQGDTLSVFKLGQDGKLTLVGQPTPTRAEPTAVLIHDLD